MHLCELTELWRMQAQKLVDDTRASMVEWQAKLVKLADGAHSSSISLFPPKSFSPPHSTLSVPEK